MNKHTRFLRPLLCVALFCLVFVRAAAQLGNLALTPADSGILGQADLGGGWGASPNGFSFVFQVNAPIEVTALGLYFYTNNSLDAGYTLTLFHWDGDSSLDATLASTSINSGSPFYNSSLNHNFSYGTVTPVTLTPGNTYVMSSSGANAGDFFYQTSNYGPASEIIFYQSLSGSNIPTGDTSGGSNAFGPNFFYTAAVPEPATAGTWLGLAALVLGLVVRRGLRVAS